MWRAFFLAIGVSLMILGGECLIIDKAVLAGPKPWAEKAAADPVGKITGASREVQPPEWAPWSLLSAGAVVMLYSFTIPRRVSN